MVLVVIPALLAFLVSCASGYLILPCKDFNVKPPCPKEQGNVYYCLEGGAKSGCNMATPFPDSACPLQCLDDGVKTEHWAGYRAPPPPAVPDSPPPWAPSPPPQCDYTETEHTLTYRNTNTKERVPYWWDTSCENKICIETCTSKAKVHNCESDLDYSLLLDLATSDGPIEGLSYLLEVKNVCPTECDGEYCDLRKRSSRRLFQNTEPSCPAPAACINVFADLKNCETKCVDNPDYVRADDFLGWMEEEDSNVDLCNFRATVTLHQTCSVCEGDKW